MKRLLVSLYLAALWTGAGRGAEPAQDEPAYQGRPLHDWVGRLQGIDNQAGEEAVVALTHIGPPAVPALIKVLKEKLAVPRRRAAEVLGRIGPEAWDAIPALAGLLTNELAGDQAAQALIRMGRTALPILGEALKEERGTRLRVINALGNCELTETIAVIPLLEAAQRDPDRYTQWAATAALERVKTIEQLPKALGDPDPLVRWQAVWPLAQLGWRGIHALAEALKDPNDGVRETVALALGSLWVDDQAEAAVPALGEALLLDKDVLVRFRAARALEAIGPGARPAVPALIMALKDPDDGVRERAIMALDAIGPGARNALAALQEIGKDKAFAWRSQQAQRRILTGEPLVRGWIRWSALVRGWIRWSALRPESSFPPITIEMLKNAKPQAREMVQEALEAKGLFPPTVPPFDVVLKDADPYVRFWFAQAFAQRKTAKVSTVAVAALKDADEGVRRAGTAALSRMSRDERPATVSVLGQALKDKDLEVRQVAASALSHVGADAQPVIPALVKALHDEDMIVRGRARLALSKIGPPALPALLELLADPNPEVRQAALFALGKIGPTAKEAVPALVKALKDPDAGLRDEAGRALKKIDPDAAAKAGVR